MSVNALTSSKIGVVIIFKLLFGMLVTELGYLFDGMCIETKLGKNLRFMLQGVTERYANIERYVYNCYITSRIIYRDINMQIKTLFE